ncbi:monovalent cation/H+ antiporter complex subunit F [Streptomyces sp. NBC_00820]|uniref:monovalent cation/H+ antiporter complex subunit F n=1 Tax=Streptomyces sp. NBC_00820 TaxID=2975842 RepID=UPI002ECFF545|nr:monovalent cation/H+ antiporter complex subunit F [Streptomyces sp. NBC_00820]
MNGWILAATVELGGGGAAVLWGVTTGPTARRAVAQNLATSVVCPALLLLAQGYGRPSYLDLALLAAILGPVGTLVFARLLADEEERDRTGARGPTWAAAALCAAVVVALCVATGPSRALAKPVVIGALVITGNFVASRALSSGLRGVRGD